MTDFPVPALVTFKRVPNFSVLCAAVMADGFMRSPEAVREVSAYHDAPPHCAAKLGADTPSDRHKAMKVNDSFKTDISNLDAG